MNKSLSAYVKVDGSSVWVDLVHKMVPMVDQVLLQISKPERVKLTTERVTTEIPAVFNHNQQLAVL